MSKRQEMREFLDKLYVPKKLDDSFKDLELFINAESELVFRSPNQNDSFKSHYTCVNIKTKGDSKWTTFAGWEIAYIDFAHVGKTYAEAYIYNDDGKGYPCRINIDSPKLAIIF